jgi:hypothetical protein
VIYGNRDGQPEPIDCRVQYGRDTAP